MSYCNQCGAYIPDGQTKCLACGFDLNEPRRAAGARQQEKSWAEQELERERREQERRRKQEEYRQSAQEEYERRRAREEERRQQQEEYRRSAQQEQERRQTQRAGGSRPAGGGELSDLGARLLAMVSYFNFLWILPYLICPGNQFVRFHARQGFALFLFEIVAGVVTGFVGLGWALNLFGLFCAIKGIVCALSGRMEPLPLVGRLADKFR